MLSEEERKERRRASVKKYDDTHKEQYKAYYQANKAAWRERQLRREYGITMQEFNDLLEKQGNKCAICGTTTLTKKGWAVDHNHQSGKVRGILCQYCNVGLGVFDDSTETMRAAIKYLEG